MHLFILWCNINSSINYNTHFILLILVISIKDIGVYSLFNSVDAFINIFSKFKDFFSYNCLKIKNY